MSPTDTAAPLIALAVLLFGFTAIATVWLGIKALVWLFRKRHE